MGGQVGIGDHVDIGDQATLGAQSGVMNNIPAKSVYLGSPALPIKDQMRNWAVVGKIAEWYHKWKDMLRRIERLEQVLQEEQTRPTAAPATTQPAPMSDRRVA
jgi:UDP-3-O-[3-hydroxymyristoyl] glucosamine N-acyltransferase